MQTFIHGQAKKDRRTNERRYLVRNTAMPHGMLNVPIQRFFRQFIPEYST
jgi:hypothetical protein